MLATIWGDNFFSCLHERKAHSENTTWHLHLASEIELPQGNSIDKQQFAHGFSPSNLHRLRLLRLVLNGSISLGIHNYNQPITLNKADSKVTKQGTQVFRTLALQLVKIWKWMLFENLEYIHYKKVKHWHYAAVIVCYRRYSWK